MSALQAKAEDPIAGPAGEQALRLDLSRCSIPSTNGLLAPALAVLLLGTFATAANLRWDVVVRYLFAPPILHGLVFTLLITAAAMTIGIVGGVILALMRASGWRSLVVTSTVYVWLLRGTPILVQLLFWFNIKALLPTWYIALFRGTGFDINVLLPPLGAAILGFGLNEAAYMSEIVRAGLASIDGGQIQAARALGMTRAEVYRRIVLPQALPVLIPPTVNELIGLLKTSSLASVITVTELLGATQLIFAVNYFTIPLLVVASLWYLLITSLLSIAQHHLERRYNRGLTHHGQRA